MFTSLSLVGKRLIQNSSLTPIKNSYRFLYVTSTDSAARKGTREKARKKKVKVEEKKVGFIPHNLRGKDKIQLSKISKHVDDSWKAVSTDNVWVAKYYRWRIYTVLEAVQCHRETHHPTMYNLPESPLNVQIELNMQAEKTTRFVDNFSRMAMIPHGFDQNEERSIIVFCKGQDLQKEATDAGATLVGGVELIKDIQNGDLNMSDFQYAIGHPNILPELVPIRGLMRKKFPNPKIGNLGINVGELVYKFSTGIQYSTVKDEHQQDYGVIETCIGTLNMNPAHLEANLAAVLKDINSVRPKREGLFITRVLLKSPPSSERLKIDPFVYIESDNNKENEKIDKNDMEEEDDDTEKKISVVQ